MQESREERDLARRINRCIQCWVVELTQEVNYEVASADEENFAKDEGSARRDIGRIGIEIKRCIGRLVRRRDITIGASYPETITESLEDFPGGLLVRHFAVIFDGSGKMPVGIETPLS